MMHAFINIQDCFFGKFDKISGIVRNNDNNNKNSLSLILIIF